MIAISSFRTKIVILIVFRIKNTAIKTINPTKILPHTRIFLNSWIIVLIALPPYVAWTTPSIFEIFFVTFEIFVLSFNSTFKTSYKGFLSSPLYCLNIAPFSLINASNSSSLLEYVTFFTEARDEIESDNSLISSSSSVGFKETWIINSFSIWLVNPPTFI